MTGVDYSPLWEPRFANWTQAAIAAHLNFLYVMAQQAIADPGQRDYASGQVAGLLCEDLDDLARFLDLAEDLLQARR